MPAAPPLVAAKVRSAWRHSGLCHSASPVNAIVRWPSPTVDGVEVVVGGFVEVVVVGRCVVVVVDVDVGRSPPSLSS